MERRDYFKKQIDQLGRVLGKILSDLLGQKNNGRVEEGISAATQALNDTAAIDLEEFIAIPTEELISFLQETKGFTNENQELLADTLLVIAENDPDDAKVQKLTCRCLVIYEHLEKTSQTFSLSRRFKIDAIKEGNGIN